MTGSCCRSCNQPIVWIRTAAIRAMPCDPDVLTVITDEGKVVKGRISHFATCPQAAEWRQKPEPSKNSKGPMAI